VKEPWYSGIPDYLSTLANGRNSPKLLIVCLIFSVGASLVNRWLYQECPAMNLALKVPLGLLFAAGTVAGIYVFGVLSYSYNKSRHVLFGLIQWVVIIATARFAMFHLGEAGLEPLSGPPMFGGLLGSVIIGWILGVLLAGLKRCESEG